MDSYEDDYDYDDQYDDDEYYDGLPIAKIVAGVVAALLVTVGAFLLFRDSPDDRIIPVSSEPASSVADDEEDAGTQAASDEPESAAVASTDGEDDEDPDTSPDRTVPTTDRPNSTVSAVAAASSSAAPSTTTAPPATTTTTTSTTAPTTTVAASTSTTAATVQGPSYPTLPDGTPQPIVVVYDTDSITLTGVVPSAESQTRLEALAVANSNFPEATLISLLTVDPTIPIGVGVRVIELNSARFPPGSTEITPEHAAQLSRVVEIMNVLENVTVTVIGHADQRGDPGQNFALSQARAVAVTNFLAFGGISPDRMSARAVGEDDLLSAADDDAALALNRRTEFTFYGLLVE